MTRDTTFWDADPNVTPLWTFRLQRAKSGEPLANLYNALVALREAPEFAGKLRYDEMTCTILLNNLPITDKDIIHTQEWLQTKGIRRMGSDTVRDAILAVSHEHAFHPLRDRLQSLQWDRKYRLNYWLTTYLGAEPTDYTQVIGPKFIIAMVARIFRPGCKADHMLVLQGPQNIEKSRICRALAGDDYFSDTLPDLASDHVRVAMHLRGKWIIEIAELHAFFNSKVSAARLKSFVTTQTEQYTPKYGRGEVREHRQCLFIGTTNKETFLLDETGNRRFWPVTCGKIDTDTFLAHRDQLLAEAVHRFQKGEEWWPNKDFEASTIAPQQAERFHGDAWDSLIAGWDFTDADRDDNGRPLYEIESDNFGNPRHTDTPLRHDLDPPYYLVEIASGALHIDPQRLTKSEEMRIVKVLESLGWNRGNKTMRGRPWFPPKSDISDDNDTMTP